MCSHRATILPFVSPNSSCPLPRHFILVSAPPLSLYGPVLQLVEKVAVPVLEDQLSNAYDAMSRRQTLCLTAAVGELLLYDPGEAALTKLLGAALSALQVSGPRVRRAASYADRI